MNKSVALLALRLVAAQAAKLADDLERNRLWDGDLASGLDQIQGAINDAHREAANA